MMGTSWNRTRQRSPFRALLELEMRSYRVFRNNSDLVVRPTLTKFVLVALLILGTVVPGEVIKRPENIAVFVLIVWLFSDVFVGIAVSLRITMSGQRDWWLSFPYSRWLLLFSKWCASLLNAIRWFGVLFLWGVAIYLVHRVFQPVIAHSGGNFLLFVIMAVGSAFIALPILNTLTLCLVLLWSRWSGRMEFVVLSVLVLAFVLLQILWKLSDNPPFQVWGYVLLISALAGWPLSAVLLRIAAKHLPTLVNGTRERQYRGVGRDFSNNHLERFDVSTPDEDLDQANSNSMASAAWLRWYEKVTGRPVTRTFTLMSLQASRLQWFGWPSNRPLRWWIYLLPLAGFGTGLIIYQKALLTEIPAGFVLVSSVFMMWMGNRFSDWTWKSSMEWFLTFPVPRWIILVTSVIAWWVRIGGIVVATEAALWLGILIHGAVSPMPGADYMLSAEALGRVALLAVTVLPLLDILLRTIHYALQGWTTLVQAALVVLVWILAIHGDHHVSVFTNSHSWLLKPDFWVILIVVLVVAIPTAWWFVAKASRNLYLDLTNPLRAHRRP